MFVKTFHVVSYDAEEFNSLVSDMAKKIKRRYFWATIRFQYSTCYSFDGTIIYSCLFLVSF